MKLSFALKPKEKPVGAAPPLKKPTAFSGFDDDEPVDTAETSTAGLKALPNKKLIAQNVESSKAMKKRMEAERLVDATVYDYDGVYDKMQEAKSRQKEAKEADNKERKPKYISALLATAATRKLDHLRAEEKMMQREREIEGDEFADKEEFVTQAYKDQMAEVRRAEEEEKEREEAAKKKNGGASTGMAHFYKKFLEDSEQQHEETVAATTATAAKLTIGPQGPAPNLTITKPSELSKKSDAVLAKEARERGVDVELNDDNQIVDKRELLAAGLNLSAPDTRRLGLQKSQKAAGTDGDTPEIHRAVGTAASRKEINERRAREIRQQMVQEDARTAEAKALAEHEATQRIISKRNNEEDVQTAKERYLARKRRKLEEEQVAANPGGDAP